MLHRYELVTETGQTIGTREFQLSDWQPGHIITLAPKLQYKVLRVQGNRLVVEAH